MQLKAVPKSINEVFSLNKQYVVPRFQREFSWDIEQVRDFWDDLIAAVSVDPKTKTAVCSEYFIGPLVLIGDDSASHFSIVDGQQRLTTITILLRALVDALENAGEKPAADAVYANYIEGKDNDGTPYFKLKNETPKPYFQNEIQFRVAESGQLPQTDEEKALAATYEVWSAILVPSNLASHLPGLTHNAALKAVRDQTLNFLRVVNISVADEDDAYSIFETLNARGLNLSSTDLIKNTLLRRLKTTHPHDNAKAAWEKLRTTLKECATDVETFFRHYWNSKFSHSSEDRLYKSFKRALKAKQIASEKTFLSELLKEASTYKKIAKPARADWKEKHRAPMYWSLDALDVFRVSQPRPFILALLSSPHVDDGMAKQALQSIEHFHFGYTAICSLRASGMDSKYGSAARELRSAKSKSAAKRVIKELVGELRAKLPALDVFVQHFGAVVVTNKDDRQKKVVQYFFRRLEVHAHGSNELFPEDLSLEHIENQSGGKSFTGMIGNLLPLGGKLNSDLGSKKFAEKLRAYGGSAFKVVAQFVAINSGKTAWGKADVEARTKELAVMAYTKIFVV